MGEFLTKAEVGGDWLIRTGESPDFERESKTVTNSGEEDMVLPAGYPMDDNVPVAASDIANTDGLLLQGITIAPDEVVKVAVVQRGHIVVNRDALPTTYYDTGGSITMSAFQTRLEAMGFVVRREPTQQAEQES